MANYIVDMDALFQCCDFLTTRVINGTDYAPVDNVRALIQRFPKQKIEETITVEVKRDIKVVE